MQEMWNGETLDEIVEENQEDKKESWRGELKNDKS